MSAMLHMSSLALANRQEVAFIDGGVAGWDALLDQLPSDVEVVLLKPGEDALAQMAQWAATHSGYDAIHVLSHGAQGALTLGGSHLNAASLSGAAVRGELAALGQALKADGDLLLYGCNVAGGAQGRAFIETLATLTGADIAASTDSTGAESIGGNWSLEAHTGVIQAPPLQLMGYTGLLGTISFTSSDSDVSGASIVRQDSSRNFTFSGGAAAGGMFVDPSYGDLLYAYEGPGSQIKLTVSIEAGYTFDLTSLLVGSDINTAVGIELTYGNGTQATFNQTVNVNSITSIGSFSTAINDVKQIVFSAANFMAFNNFAITDVKAIVAPATVSAANIAYISSGSGTAGAYKIGDTVTVSWNNSGTGDNNSGVSGVAVDFSQFGGGSVTAINTSGVWSASYTITAGAVDAINRHVTVSATNSGGASAPVADAAGKVVDNIAPTVSDARIAIGGASGTSGAFKVGDTVTATWNNTAGGDNNTDTISSATVNFSQFGGGSAVAASNSSGTWTATYTITSGAIDTTSRNVSFTATDNAGNTTTRADTSNATVDSIPPTVSDGRIAISGGSGPGGAYKIGDTVTVSWNNTAGGDNNSDTVSGVAVDFTQFGGGAAVAATNSSGTWTATYTITAGAISASNRNVTVTATDNAGNATTTADTTNATVDNAAPVITLSALALSADSGTAGDFITGTAAQTISATLSAALGGGEKVMASLDNGGTWTDVTSQVTGTSLTWSTTLGASNTLKLKVTDAAGNDGAVLSQAYVLDASAPSAPSTADLATGSDTGASNTDNITADNTPTLTGTAESGATVTLYDTDGTTVLGTTTATGGTWSITGSALSDGSHTLTSKATDVAGNVSSASSGLAVAIDTAAPTAVGLGTSTVAVASAGSGATVAGLQATDAHAVTYALVTGNGTNDADNASFVISGGNLVVGGAPLSAGSYNLYLAATDAAGNVSNQAVTFTVVNAPSVTSIVRAGGAGSTLAGSATSTSYTVTFSESVNGVDASDFMLTSGGTAAASINSVSGSGAAYTVTVDSLGGDGTLRLDLKGSGTGIKSLGNVDIAAGYTSGQTYTLDHTVPGVSSIVRVGAAASNAGSVDYTVTFSESVTGVDVSDFLLTAGGSAAGTISAITGSGTTYTVTAGSVTGDGTLRLDLKGSGTGIADAAGNGVSGAYSAGQSYTFDHTAPAITSIVRVGGASTNAASVDYTVTFAEGVTGVDISDFVLTTGGTASGSIAAITGSGATYTVTVASAAGEGTLRLDLNNSGTGITDAQGNAATAGYTSGATYTLDHVAPTLAIASSTSTLAVGATATITFTFSEDPGASFVPGDVSATGGTISSLSGSGNVRTATYTATTQGAGGVVVASNAYADLAGNNGAGATAPALTINPATSNPGGGNNGTVDGVPVNTTTSTDAQSGLTVQTITVPTIVPGRQDDPNTPNAALADIPLGAGGSSGPHTSLTVSLPVGTGLSAQGPSTLLDNAQALLDLIQRIEARTAGGSATQVDMTGQGEGFLGVLGANVMLQTATVILESASAATLTLDGNSGGQSGTGSGTAIGLVVDASHLAAGSVLNLNNVEFAAVVGALTMRGGAGANHVVGDGASQNIMLGPEDDILSGGGGNDFIGSRGGDDLLDGGADNDLVAGGEGRDTIAGGSGNDILQGGRSDSGDWRFFVSDSGGVTANHTHAVLANGMQETVQRSELNAAAPALSFLAQDSARLVDIALLYGALDRVPELAGMAFWARAPFSIHAVAEGVAQSAEWQTANGQQDNAGFVTSLYQHVLDRAPEAQGLAYWTGLMALGMSRGDVLAGIALSDEHRALAKGAQGFAIGEELALCESEWFADSGDDILNGGAGNDVLVGGDGHDTAVFGAARADYRLLIAADGEVRMRQQSSGDTDTLSGIETASFGNGALQLDFLSAPPARLKTVGLLYEAVLDRAADEGGLRFWLASGNDDAGLARGFDGSGEFQARFGGMSNAAFVQALYDNSGLAASTAGGSAQWQDYLASHSRAELIGAWVANADVQAAQFGGNGLWLV